MIRISELSPAARPLNDPADIQYRTGMKCSRSALFPFLVPLLGLFMGQAIAAATSVVPIPSVEGPIPVTAASHVWNGAEWQWVPIHLEAHGYVEEEHYVSGTANVYEVLPASDYQVKALRSGPYTTRIIVRRPANMRRWSGRVAVEIINMSAGYDWTANWAALWESIIERRDIYVGITSKPNVLPGMTRFDAARYGRLSFANPLPPAEQTCGRLPSESGYDPNLSRLYENGLAYDIFSQVGALLKSSSPMNPLGSPARRAYLVGESQSGGYINVYYKWIHQLARLPDGKPVFDGFLIEDFGTGPSSSAALHQCAAPLAADDPQRVLNHHAEPLVVVNSQVFYPRVGRPPNSDAPGNRFMLWMTAGASHGWTQQYDYSDAAREDLQKAGFVVGDGDFSHFTCDQRQPEIELYMFERTLYAYLDRWVSSGKAPPAAPDPEIQNGQYVLDADGNILGGLRMPEMEVPIATYRGTLTPSADCTSAVQPFSSQRLQQLYATHRLYTRAFKRAANGLVKQGFLLSTDARRLIARAKAAPVPKAEDEEGK